MRRPVSLGISGIVTGIPAGAAVTVNITASIQHGMIMFRNKPEPDGSFSMNQLQPGTYLVFAQSGNPELTSAPVKFELSDSPVANIELGLQPGSDLAGSVNATADAIRLQPVTKDNFGPRSAPVNSAPVNQQGTFQFSRIQAGPAPIVSGINQMPGNAWIKTLRLGPREMPDRILDLTQGPRRPDPSP